MRLLAFLLLVVGCTPLTQYRQTAMVGMTAPMPAAGPALEQGEIAAGGAWDFGFRPTDEAIVAGLLPEPGDPGLLVGGHQGHVYVRYGAQHFEWGARAELTPRGVTRATSIGVLPMEHGEVTWGVGPTLGWTSDRSEHGLAGSLRSELLVVSIPYSRYELRNASFQGAYVLGDGSSFYEQIDGGTERKLKLSGSAGLDFTRGPGDLGVGLGVTQQHTNVGYSDKEEDPVIQGSPALFFTLHGGIRVDRARFGVQAWMVPVGRQAKANMSPLGGITTQVEFRGRLRPKPPEPDRIDED